MAFHKNKTENGLHGYCQETRQEKSYSALSKQNNFRFLQKGRHRLIKEVKHEECVAFPCPGNNQVFQMLPTNGASKSG